MKYYMGISALQSKSAAALIDEDGNIICLSEEERRTGILNDKSWPKESINWCIHHAQALGHDVKGNDIVYAYYEKPLAKACRRICYNPKRSWSFLKDAFTPYKEMVSFTAHEYEMISYKTSTTSLYIAPPLMKLNWPKFASNHKAHALAACATSPFDEAMYLVMDIVGEWKSTSWEYHSG